MNERALLAVLALALVGVAVLALGGSLTDVTYQSEPTPSSATPGEPDSTGLAVVESGHTCLDETLADRSGWVQVTGNGEDATVRFDLVIRAGASDDADFDLTNRGTGDFVLTVDTGDAPTADDSDCPAIVRFQGSGRAPDVETLRVTLNGEEIHRIERADSFAAHRPLPEPIPGNASSAS